MAFEYMARKPRSCPKCGAESLRNHAYCRDCKNAWSRRYVDSLPESERLKISARAKLNHYVKRGLITKQPCEICECDEVQGHHDDYTRPFDVHWLCAKCHGSYHRQDNLFKRFSNDKQLTFDFAS